MKQKIFEESDAETIITQPVTVENTRNQRVVTLRGREYFMQINFEGNTRVRKVIEDPKFLSSVYT